MLVNAVSHWHQWRLIHRIRGKRAPTTGLRRGRALRLFGLHSSLFGSIPGNNTSINPNRLKSVILEGYKRPIR